MQLIAETYDLLKNGLQLSNPAIHAVFTAWNEGRLQSFLLEITRDIFAFQNPETKHLLLDDIKDEAKSKGTGKWTSQFAMDLQCPIPVIDAAVSTRDLSKYKTLRGQLAESFAHKKTLISEDSANYILQLEQAFFASMIGIYAQGMHLLLIASIAYRYDLKLHEIAKIWRGGCIIRSKFLEDIFSAYQKNPGLAHLFEDANIQAMLQGSLKDTRSVVTGAMAKGFSVPVFAASLNYFDAMHNDQMPTNLIQAQRDYFGAHTYELIGKEGVFHSQWSL